MIGLKPSPGAFVAGSDTWIPFASGLGGALIGALSSLGATALAGRQRRAERREEAEQARRDREEELQRQARDEERLGRKQKLSDLIHTATSAMALASDVSARTAPRGRYVSAEELRAYQDRADAIESALGSLVITHPAEAVSRAARDLLAKLPLSLGTMTDHSPVSDRGREEALVQAAVDSAQNLFDVARIQEMSARNGSGDDASLAG
jgi:type II secretory pathway pseudopilin PulG